MNPFVIAAIAVGFASAFSGQPATSSQAADSSISPQDYATIMASISSCGLQIDMTRVGQLMAESGIDPKSQQDAEKLGAMMWEETQRVVAMPAGEQQRHCADMRVKVEGLGL